MSANSESQKLETNYLDQIITKDHIKLQNQYKR